MPAENIQRPQALEFSGRSEKPGLFLAQSVILLDCLVEDGDWITMLRHVRPVCRQSGVRRRLLVHVKAPTWAS
jgi:hypothetical protein